MANKQFLHYPANLSVNDLGGNQNAPMVPSFTNRDDDYAIKSSFYPDYGSTGLYFSANVDNKSDFINNYLVKPGGVWNGNQNDGFIIEKNSSQMVDFNLRIYGYPGHWIPASMLKGFSFQELYATAFNSNWRTRRLALEFVNYETNESRSYAPNWNNAAQAQNKYVFRNMSSQSHWDIIRSWGPKWVLYGAIFNIRSESTSAVQRPKMHLYSVRVAWQTTGLSGSTRWIPFKYGGFSDFQSNMRDKGWAEFARV